jgi:DNA-binding NarL/FixJ family response regulator
MKAQRLECERIRIVLADDHAVFSETLRSFLEGKPGLQVEGVATDAESAESLIRAAGPDVAILDLSMPGGDTISLIERISRETVARVVVLSMYCDADAVGRAITAGAVGFVAKGESTETLLTAIRVCHAGGTFLSEAATAASRSRPLPVRELTAREQEVAESLASGLSIAEAAERLAISYKTAHMHAKSAMRRVGVENANDLREVMRTAMRFR